jgi:hypothetical protein
MDISETTCDRIGLFGIKMGNVVLLESLPFRYFAQASQIWAVSIAEPFHNVLVHKCMFSYRCIVDFSAICILKHKDINRLVVPDR